MAVLKTERATLEFACVVYHRHWFNLSSFSAPRTMSAGTSLSRGYWRRSHRFRSWWSSSKQKSAARREIPRTMWSSTGRDWHSKFRVREIFAKIFPKSANSKVSLVTCESQLLKLLQLVKFYSLNENLYSPKFYHHYYF